MTDDKIIYLCDLIQKKHMSWKILVNDGMHPTGAAQLSEAGMKVDQTTIPQDQLAAKLNDYDAIVVRSATKVRKELIDLCPNLKMIVRGGVGMDNIDVEYARAKGLVVANTPSASSRSVAELVIGQMITMSRFLHLSNREMPTKGNTEFKNLKKSYSKGLELEGKNICIIGCGRIGLSLAQLAIGMGMNVLPVDPFMKDHIHFDFNITNTLVHVKLPLLSLNDALAQADYISLHVPFLGEALIGAKEFLIMNSNAILVNAARGGVVDEMALLTALDNGDIRGAALDVFVNEPTPIDALMNHPKVSVTPHIGASTAEAQEKIGIEIAKQIIATQGQND